METISIQIITSYIARRKLQLDDKLGVRITNIQDSVDSCLFDDASKNLLDAVRHEAQIDELENLAAAINQGML